MGGAACWSWAWTTRRADVVGIPLDALDTVEAWVREICNDVLKPALDATIRKIELPNAAGDLLPVLCVDIERSLFVHKSHGGYFRRLGSSKREMSPELLARLFQERSQTRMIRFDESVVPRTTPGDLDYALTRRFLQNDSSEEGVSELAARKLRLVADDDGEGPADARWRPAVHARAATVVVSRVRAGSQLCRRAHRHRLPD